MAAVTEPASDDEQEAQRKAERKADSKAAGIFVYSRTGVALLQVALLPILTRLCDKLEVAYVQALVVLYVGAVGIGSLGLPDAVFYFLGRTPERGAAIVRQTSVLLLVAAGPVVAVVRLVTRTPGLVGTPVTVKPTVLLTATTPRLAVVTPPTVLPAVAPLKVTLAGSSLVTRIVAGLGPRFRTWMV